MLQSSVRQMAASYGGNKFATAAFERCVSVWDVESRMRQSKFDTCLDFGGQRLAIAETGEFLATGSFRERVLVTYRVSDGSPVWVRDDLGPIQRVSFAPLTGELLVSVEGFQSFRLEAESGKTIEIYPEVVKLADSPFQSNIEMRETKGNIGIYTSGRWMELFSVVKRSFAVLSVAFSPDRVVISESGGGVRCFNLDNGILAWQYDPPAGSHVLSLMYDEASGHVAGILWDYETGGEKRIIILDRTTGEILRDSPIEGNSSEGVFVCRGGRFVTSDGLVYHLSTLGAPTVPGHIGFS